MSSHTQLLGYLVDKSTASDILNIHTNAVSNLVKESFSINVNNPITSFYDSFQIDYIEIPNNIKLSDINTLIIEINQIIVMNIPFYLIEALSTDIKLKNNSTLIKFNNELFGTKNDEKFTSIYYVQNSIPIYNTSIYINAQCSTHEKINMYMKYFVCARTGSKTHLVYSEFKCYANRINMSISNSYNIRPKFMTSGIFLKCPEINYFAMTTNYGKICEYDNNIFDLYIKKIKKYKQFNDEQKNAFIDCINKFLPIEIIYIIIEMLKIEDEFLYWIPFNNLHKDSMNQSEGSIYCYGIRNLKFNIYYVNKQSNDKKISFSTLSWNKFMMDEKYFVVKMAC